MLKAMGSHLQVIKQGSETVRFAFCNRSKTFIMLTAGSQIPIRGTFNEKILDNEPLGIEGHTLKV